MWTIHGEEVVCLGDTTTHGGKVISASSSVTYLGRPIARVGDKVTCPKCKGIHTIVSGALTAFDNGLLIACNGDSVSCGAKLIAANGSTCVQGEFLGFRMPWETPEPEPEPTPGRGLSKEEYCRYAMILQNSEVFRNTLKHMAELTKKNGVEYSCWFVQDPDGTIRAVDMKTDNLPLEVAPGKKPKGAIGQVHTHTASIFPSEQDYKYYSTQPLENRPYVYGVVDSSGNVWMVDDAGNDLVCKNAQ